MHDRMKWRELINEGNANSRCQPWRGTVCMDFGQTASVLSTQPINNNDDDISTQHTSQSFAARCIHFVNCMLSLSQVKHVTCTNYHLVVLII